MPRPLCLRGPEALFLARARGPDTQHFLASVLGVADHVGRAALATSGQLVPHRYQDVGNGIVQVRNMVTGSRVATLSAAPGSAADRRGGFLIICRSWPPGSSVVVAKSFDRLPDETWGLPGHGGDPTLEAQSPHLQEWRARGW